MFAFVFALTFVLMLLAFRSIVIAVKAIVLNALSVAAAYGILVLVFQDGVGRGLIGASSGGIESFMPMFLFVILFGLSMDYHVFIISRIREGVDQGMSTDEAVEHGIKTTAGVVTSAAVVMVLVFSVFITSVVRPAEAVRRRLGRRRLDRRDDHPGGLAPGEHEAARRLELVPPQLARMAATGRRRNRARADRRSTSSAGREGRDAVIRSGTRAMSAGRVILIVLGSIGVLFGLALLAGGGFLLWADRTQREDGYLTTPTERFATSTYALTRTRLEIDTDGPGWLLNDSWFGKVRIRGESPGAKMLFIGIGPEAAVAKYLGSVAHANVQDIDFDPFRVTYLPIAGGAPQAPPTEQRFWAVSASGVGNTDGDVEGARGRLVGRPDERRRLAWCRCRHRRRRQAVVPALGRDRVAPRRRARGWGQHRVDCPCRADATATARAVGASYRGQRIRKYAGTRASRPINRRAHAQLNAVSLSPTETNAMANDCESLAGPFG